MVSDIGAYRPSSKWVRDKEQIVSDIGAYRPSSKWVRDKEQIVSDISYHLNH